MSLLGGSLRNWVVFERPLAVQDPTGQAKIQWTRAFGCWAAFANQAGLEVPTGQMPETRVSWRVTIRYRPNGPNHTYRMRLGSRLFNIAAVWNSDELSESLTLVVSEGLGHG